MSYRPTRPIERSPSKGPGETITAEVIRYSLLAAVDQMKAIILHSAYHPLLVETQDFSVGLVDANEESYASATGIPNFISTFTFTIGEAKRQWGDGAFRNGDVIITNDPYTTGTHLSDVTLVSPIIVDGAVVSYATVTAHWYDTGGANIGGWSTDTTDIHEEGIFIPYAKLYSEGDLNEDLQRTILANVREPTTMWGDLRAQIAALQLGRVRVLELVAKYGIGLVLGVIGDINDRAEVIARRNLRNLANGTYSAVVYCDSDGVRDDPVPIAIRIEKIDDIMVVDLTGTGQQNLGPLNHGWPLTLGGVRQVFKALVDPYSPLADGSFRPLELILPRGTFLSAQYPAAVGSHAVANCTLMDGMLLALEPALRQMPPGIGGDGAVAGSYGDLCATYIGGPFAEGHRWYLHGEPQGGGWGATTNRDGQSALVHFLDGDTKNVPIEKIERLYPLRVREYELRQDSGGPGRRRGGLGTMKSYEILADDAKATVCYERYKLPPWGLEGGLNGAVNYVEVERDGESRILHKASRFELPAGSVIRCLSGGGGGYGPPTERAVELVWSDVQDGYVSVEAALEHYGVICRRTKAGVDLDADGTARLRGSIANLQQPG